MATGSPEDGGGRPGDARLASAGHTGGRGRLLHVGGFRVGGEEYAEENETFGVATLQVRHVRVDGDRVVFSYRAKSAVNRTVVIEDSEILRVVRSLLRRDRKSKDDLLAWRSGSEWRNVRSSDLNAYIKEIIGDEFSAKDFRTWSATVRAAFELASRVTQASSERERKRTNVAAVAEVAIHLGNTPAVRGRKTKMGHLLVNQGRRLHGQTTGKFSVGRLIPFAVVGSPSICVSPIAMCPPVIPLRTLPGRPHLPP